MTKPPLEIIAQHKIVPVLVVEHAGSAEPLGAALVAGGLPIAEVTFRTEAAAEVIRTMAANDALLVGAGTVLFVDQVDEAIEAGARFIVSPGTNPKVVRRCLDRGIPIFPGVSSPTDIEVALDHGLEVVKFFPAEAIGGVAMLRAVAAPYGMMRFIPTGGIGPGNIGSYLEIPQVVACGGSWMASKKLIDAGQLDKLTESIREATRLL